MIAICAVLPRLQEASDKLINCLITHVTNFLTTAFPPTPASMLNVTYVAMTMLIELLCRAAPPSRLPPPSVSLKTWHGPDGQH